MENLLDLFRIKVICFNLNPTLWETQEAIQPDFLCSKRHFSLAKNIVSLSFYGISKLHKKKLILMKKLIKNTNKNKINTT